MAASCPSAKPHGSVNDDEHLKSERAEKDDHNDLDQIEEEEDPYHLNPEDIYDTVDPNSTYNPVILNRPPAPFPRPDPESEKPMIFTGIEQSLFLSLKCSLYTTDFIKLLSRLIDDFIFDSIFR